MRTSRSIITASILAGLVSVLHGRRLPPIASPIKQWTISSGKMAPSRVLLSVTLPCATATLPNTCTLIGPFSNDSNLSQSPIGCRRSTADRDAGNAVWRNGEHFNVERLRRNI
jgi:hypothetical protein